MKKYLFALACLMMMGLHVQAQKFLDFYYQGSVVSSVNASDIDSMVIGTNPTNRTVDLYKNGDIFHSTTAARVDSVKVFKPENAPLVYLGIIGFNQELYKKEFGILSTSTASGFKTFVGNLTCKDGTLLYYGVDKALDMLKSTSFPTQVNSVNLITFTDGLDQGSMMMNGSYTTDEQYLNAVHQLIVNTRVKGLPLTAYSLGLKGSDVTNYTLFQNNLTKLASSSDKAIEVSSMSAVRTRLQEISDQIISISNKQTVSMKIPGPSNGTIIRFTFDNATAANSSMYIEGTFNLSDRSLRNVKYYGIKGGSGTIVQGKQEGIFVTYTFSGLQRTDGNGLIPVNSIREFYRSSTTNTWQENSEFTPANNTQTNITHSGAIILLVLDCSSSLGSQFSNMKSYAQDFITRVANNAEPYEFLAPTNVKAELEVKDEKFVVNVSWNAVKYAESYNVYRSNSSNGTYELVAEGVTSTIWTDDSPLKGYNYYKVCAKNGNEASSQSSYASVTVSLAAPTNVEAEIDENDLVVNVSWDAVKYAQSYDVYRSSSSSGTYSLVAEGITSTTWIDDSPQKGYNYYKVCAEGYGFTSFQSSYASVNVSLAAPTNVKAKIDENDLVVNVSWDAVKYAQSYKVYRSSSYSGTYSLVADGITSTTWIDDSPQKGDNYYKVCAEGYGFTSSQSSYASVEVRLAAPTNVEAEIDENDLVVNVSWDAVKYAQSYKVYRGSSWGTYSLVAEGITSTTWIDDSPQKGSNFYVVCAEGYGFTSSQSSSYDHVNVSLAAPTNVEAEIDENDLVVNVSWDAVKYAQSYKVYRSSSSGGTYSLVAEGVTSTTWKDESPQEGYNYYKVCAVNRNIISSQSSYASVKVSLVLSTPTNIKAEVDVKDDNFVVNVSWDAVKYAQSYKVYRSSSSSGTYSLVAEGVTSTTWKDESPQKGYNYYKVCAEGYGFTSSRSSYSYVNVSLVAPTNVKAEIDENDLVVNVSWDAVKYAQSYKVYRSSSSSGTYELVAEGVTSTTWKDESPQGYNYYKVCAVNRKITSTQSPYASVTVNLAAPTNIKAEVDVKDEKIVVNVSWDAVKYAESYNVYRSSSSSGTYSLIAERVTSTSWTDNNPLNGNNYYKVNAQYKDIISALSNAVPALNPTKKGPIITVNGVAFNMVKVSGGTFQMGATSEQGSDAYSDEKVHQVTLSDYYIGETEVTQELWQAVMGSNPSYFTGSGLLPVEEVSWDDCQTFITKLNVLTGMQFRLPTEAEWEFAARGGNSSQGYKYSGSNNIDDVAWYTYNSNSKTHEVGTKAPNELGLYDMSGNVWEWCQDWADSYSSSAQTNPTGPTSGSHRVNRGGSRGSSAGSCRVSKRGSIGPGDRFDSLGLRLAL